MLATAGESGRTASSGRAGGRFPLTRPTGIIGSAAAARSPLPSRGAHESRSGAAAAPEVPGFQGHSVGSRGDRAGEDISHARRAQVTHDGRDVEHGQWSPVATMPDRPEHAGPKRLKSIFLRMTPRSMSDRMGATFSQSVRAKTPLRKGLAARSR